MSRIVIVIAFAIIPGTVIGQVERTKTPSEVNEEMMKDMRGFKELLPSQPAAIPPLQFSPFTHWTKEVPKRISGADSVSVQSLQHRVPKAAKKAYDRGIQFSEKGEAPKAAEEFKKALALDPEYAAAHGDLGVQHVRLGQLKEAEAEFRKAISLDPYIAHFHSNLGWLLLHLKRFQEAEQSARRALALSDHDRAHLLLGLLLLDRPATRIEGVRHINQAAETLPYVDQFLAELR